MYFSYAQKYGDGFVDHKFIYITSSSSMLNKPLNSVSTTPAEKYETISQLPILTFETYVLNLCT